MAGGDTASVSGASNVKTGATSSKKAKMVGTDGRKAEKEQVLNTISSSKDVIEKAVINEGYERVGDKKQNGSESGPITDCFAFGVFIDSDDLKDATGFSVNIEGSFPPLQVFWRDSMYHKPIEMDGYHFGGEWERWNLSGKYISVIVADDKFKKKSVVANICEREKAWKDLSYVVTVEGKALSKGTTLTFPLKNADYLKKDGIGWLQFCAHDFTFGDIKVSDIKLLIKRH